MSTRNVQTVRALHAAFNKRDAVAMAAPLASEFAYTDEAERIVVSGRAEFVAYLTETWLGGMSDTQVSDAGYVDGGETVVATYVVRGTNDGALGPDSSRGRRIALACCEVFHFDRDGSIVRGENYYDRDSLTQQLETSSRGWRSGTVRTAASTGSKRARKPTATPKR